MKGAADVSNVVAACTVEGRQERLEAMLQQLELCKKALQVRLSMLSSPTPGLPKPALPHHLPVVDWLQDYLETKRIAFPRFYFVAPADLLDILAHGSNPQAVIRQASPTSTAAVQTGCVPRTALAVLRTSFARQSITPLSQAWFPFLPRPAGTCPSALTTSTTWSLPRTPRAPLPRLLWACTRAKESMCPLQHPAAATVQ